MNFMENKKRHRVLVVIICVVIAIAAGGAGFYFGERLQQDDVMNALPRMAHDMQAEEDAERATQAALASQAAETEKVGAFVGKSNVSAASEGTWSTVDSYNYDITGDGVNDTITLYTSAESDDMGILWNDSQQWILEVSDGGNGYYTLVDTQVSNGSVYYQVNELSGGERSIIVYITTGAGTQISEYVFGKAGFTETKIHSSTGINTLHSSIPWYK